MRFKLAIFDLDGTLADSFPWFLTHFNSIADRFGFARIVDDTGALTPLGQELRHAGSREIVQRLDVPFWKLPAIARHMRRLKARHADDIALFPGVSDMLATLEARGVTLALVSSDSEANVRRQLGEANTRLISHYACGASLFGKAAKFRRVMKRAGVLPSESLGIGDEVRDIEAARRAGIACAAVTWGYAAPEKLAALAPELVFHRLEDIVEVFFAPSDSPAGSRPEGGLFCASRLP